MLATARRKGTGLSEAGSIGGRSGGGGGVNGGMSSGKGGMNGGIISDSGGGGGGSISDGGEKEASVIILPSFLHVIQRLVRDPGAIGAVLVDGTKAVPSRYLCPAAGGGGGSSACVRKTRELELSVARRPAAADFGVDGGGVDGDAGAGGQVEEERSGGAATSDGDGTGTGGIGTRDGGGGQAGGDVAADGPKTADVDGSVSSGGGGSQSGSGSGGVRSSHSSSSGGGGGSSRDGSDATDINRLGSAASEPYPAATTNTVTRTTGAYGEYSNGGRALRE
ncbi:unnamed protein product, partial [Ectocarpus sp. 12 AP-2014]